MGPPRRGVPLKVLFLCLILEALVVHGAPNNALRTLFARLARIRFGGAESRASFHRSPEIIPDVACGSVGSGKVPDIKCAYPVHFQLIVPEIRQRRTRDPTVQSRLKIAGPLFYVEHNGSSLNSDPSHNGTPNLGAPTNSLAPVNVPKPLAAVEPADPHATSEHLTAKTKVGSPATISVDEGDLSKDTVHRESSSATSGGSEEGNTSASTPCAASSSATTGGSGKDNISTSSTPSAPWSSGTSGGSGENNISTSSTPSAPSISATSGGSGEHSISTSFTPHATSTHHLHKRQSSKAVLRSEDVGVSRPVAIDLGAGYLRQIFNSSLGDDGAYHARRYERKSHASSRASLALGMLNHRPPSRQSVRSLPAAPTGRVASLELTGGAGNANSLQDRTAL